MNISEIVTYPSRSGSIVGYQSIFTDKVQEPAFDELLYAESKGQYSYFGGLLHNNELVSVLNVTYYREHGLWQIVYSETTSEYQRQGCFRYLLIKALDHYGKVICDEHHSPEAMMAWKSLMKYTGPHFNVVVYNTNTRTEHNPSEYTDDEIWNQKSDILLMAKRVGNGLVLEKRERFYEGLKIGPDRTEMNIWFGKNSSTDVYTNP
jgi:hypothetical protein